MRAGRHVWTRLEKESDGKTGIGLSPDGMVEHDAMAASSFAASPRAMVGAVLGL